VEIPIKNPPSTHRLGLISIRGVPEKLTCALSFFDCQQSSVMTNSANIFSNHSVALQNPAIMHQERENSNKSCKYQINIIDPGTQAMQTKCIYIYNYK